MARWIQGSNWMVLALVVGIAHRGEAQRSNKPDTAKVTVVGIGRVTSKTAIVAGNRTNGGDIYASLTVTTLNNGPYYLQAKLTVPFTDKNKPTIVNDVQALTPAGTYQSLSTTTWVNVATGPGGTGKVNNVQLLVLWGKSSSKDPKQVPDIQLTFQVVPK